MMRVILQLPDGTHVEVEAGGKYSPDVMHDIKNRAIDLLGAAVEVTGEVIDEDDIETTESEAA